MRHAFCIIAHNEPDLLRLLVEFLDHPLNDIYLMIDAKSDINLFAGIKTSRSRLTFCRNRIDVFWGDHSQIRNEFNLFREARAGGNYDYYHLLSGVDMPTKPLSYIHQFFINHRGEEFISLKTWDIDGNYWINRKTSYYWLLTRYLRHPSPLVRFLTGKVRSSAIHLQRLFGINRSFPYPQLHWSDQWVSLTQNFIDYLLPLERKILKEYRLTFTTDEVFIPTVMMNSPFSDKISSKGCMRLIDWQRGNPYVWQATDIPRLIASDSLFARKFSSSTIPSPIIPLLKALSE